VTLPCAIDRPLPGDLHYRQRIPVEGWLHLPGDHARLKRISVHASGREIGATAHLYPRIDVAQALRLDPGTPVAFRLLAAIATGTAAMPPAEITVLAEFADGSVATLATVPVAFAPDDFTGAPYGDLCNPQRTGLLHRSHIYSSGYPLEHPSADCLALLTDYLTPGASVLDVGCGIGAYAGALQQRGFSWTGCETSPACLLELARRQRPHRAIKKPRWPWSRYRLPAADHEFDAVMAIEVLEHIREPGSFLSEMARVSRSQVIFSVPNLEILPFLADRMVAPWHLLEGDHRNFFTRFNLRPLLETYFRRVELLDYTRHPLRSPDGLPLAYHLFALCDV
jgi:2-polyprenyl-3-methyl-5-hydroxy-6-metoxy-1,4-benzoquinol methylase